MALLFPSYRKTVAQKALVIKEVIWELGSKPAFWAALLPCQARMKVPRSFVVWGFPYGAVPTVTGSRKQSFGWRRGELPGDFPPLENCLQGASPLLPLHRQWQEPSLTFPCVLGDCLELLPRAPCIAHCWAQRVVGSQVNMRGLKARQCLA